MTEDKTPYNAETKRDRRVAATILIWFKAILRFVIAGVILIWLTSSASSPPWIAAFAASAAVIGAAAFWAIERIGK